MQCMWRRVTHPFVEPSDCIVVFGKSRRCSESDTANRNFEFLRHLDPIGPNVGIGIRVVCVREFNE